MPLVVPLVARDNDQLWGRCITVGVGNCRINIRGIGYMRKNASSRGKTTVSYVPSVGVCVERYGLWATTVVDLNS